MDKSSTDESKDLDPEIRKLVNDNFKDLLWKESSTGERILGDLRIFQAIVNDLGLKHEQIDGRWVYTYEGTDPYELEDVHFPTITKAISQFQKPNEED